ncbi:alpha/beta hydrolase [Paractinoplanes abujensis]|uniref:Pimeloyl-ACP methyl ester carboxylesterase n=1 Tax=Paractinoplanes abujensis TaxID=882441 RepID=A0A7W7CVU1_9ACTN|nr:alpha/beta hydrolase [Actinoplanes abujensis]MBB4695640.1 pimeloyl-ACP methyl ester carboxylesterase [Actinoplanes abujensis]
MRRLLAAATTIALVVIGVPASDARAADDRGVETDRTARAARTIKWSSCTEPALRTHQAQCGFVSVPLDHSDPNGKKIQIAVSRIKHTVPDAKFQGVMLVNPGGPGAKGRGLSVLGSLVPKQAGAAYDWIGFDPRGVGASKPALSCDNDYTGYNRPAYVPTTAKLEKTWLKRAEGYAKACAKSGGELLGHLKTLDTVRDMDLIRYELGARQINFYGFSYGTYLGQVYATRYPERVRRMVLDGVVNPARVWYDSNLDQDLAFDRNIQVYFGWLAKHHRVFRLGKTTREVRQRFYAEQKQLIRRPAGGVIGPAELTDIFLQAGYYTFGWNDIARAFSDWVREGDASGLKRLYDTNNPQGKDADNNYAVYLATQCTDAPWPTSWTKWTADNWQVHRKAPFETWANAWYNAPCRTWPAPSGIPVTVSGETVPPVLMVSETLDAATPFTGALEARKRFPRSVLVEGVGGTTHSGSLYGNRCVDDTIADYLASGRLPERQDGERSDKRCSPIEPPEPVAAATADTKAKRAPVPAARLEMQKLIAGR